MSRFYVLRVKGINPFLEGLSKTDLLGRELSYDL